MIHRLLILIPINLFCLVLDQWSKIWAVEHLKGQMPRSVWSDMIVLRYAENRGAWGGLANNWPDFFRSLFLLYIPVIVLLVVLGITLKSQKVKKYEIWAYSFILAGGIGNLIDRFRFDYVVDFMWMGLTQTLQTNIFNVADMAIMTGFFLLAFYYLKEQFVSKSRRPS